MEINYWMADMTKTFLETLEEKGMSCGGLAQDWKELMDKEDADHENNSEVKKSTVEIYNPKTLEDAIGRLQQFLECDLYSKFRPKELIKGEVWTRDDSFKNKKDFYKYIEKHFSILFEQIEELKSSKQKGVKNEAIK